MSKAEQVIQKLNEFISEPVSRTSAKKVGIGMAGSLAAPSPVKRAVKQKVRQIVGK